MPTSPGGARTARCRSSGAALGLTILFDGIAHGMLLLVLASGLAVTLGRMDFINLAHGASTITGGYVTAILMNR